MTEQTDLFALARERADVGIQRAADATEAREPGWTELATEALRSFALAQSQPFAIEAARVQIARGLPPAKDLRSWGAVTRLAVRMGFIEWSGGYAAVASSNLSPKKTYCRSVNA